MPGDPDTFRRRLWNAHYEWPVSIVQLLRKHGPHHGRLERIFSPPRVTGTSSRSFDVDGGRGLALEEVEYIVYVEKAGQVEVAVEKHGYDVAWFNPSTANSSSRRRISKAKNFSASRPTARMIGCCACRVKARRKGC